MVMKFFARCIVAGTVATVVLALATGASFAAKQRSGPVAPGSCKVSGGYIPSGQACTSAPNQYGMSQLNWCSFGSLTPGIWCGGGLCSATKC
jgi:hypothetical protein